MDTRVSELDCMDFSSVNLPNARFGRYTVGDTLQAKFKACRQNSHGAEIDFWQTGTVTEAD